MEALPYLAVVVIIVAVAVILYANAHGNEQNARRLRRLETKVNLLVEQAGLAAPVDPELEPVRKLAMQGEKVRAIKLHREITGSGLAEAKTAVERIE